MAAASSTAASLHGDDAMAAAPSTATKQPLLDSAGGRPGFGSARGSSSLAAAGVLAVFYASLLVLSLVNRGGGEGEALEAVFLALHYAAHLGTWPPRPSSRTRSGLGPARATKWVVLFGPARHDRAYTVPCSGRVMGPSGGTTRHD
jgi:hypothetical protein